jgi:magnesium transporter
MRPLVLRVLRLEGDKVASGGRERAAPGAAMWVDCSPEPENLDWLASRFGFHHLALEDAATDGQRPKFEDYPGTAFVVLHRLASGSGGGAANADDQELHSFLTAEALVTVHRNPIAELDAVFARVQGDPDVLRRGPDFALYLVYDAVTDAHFAMADDLTDQVEILNEEIIEDPNERHVMRRVADLRRQLAHLRRRLAPQREVLAALARPGQPVVHERTVVYFRDVQDHVVRITEEIDVARELVAQTMEIYLSAVNNRLSTVMARMALAATIFLPLTFITGFFGMNLPGTDQRIGWWVVGGATLVLPASMWLWFKVRGWF